MSVDVDVFNIFELEYELNDGEMNGSSLWIRNDGTNDKWALHGEGVDPYDDMRWFVACGAPKHHEAMMVVHGWASPVQADLAPSDHPMRKRVRLFIYMNEGNHDYAMRLEGEPLEHQGTDGQGLLHDAIVQAVNEYNSKTGDNNE